MSQQQNDNGNGSSRRDFLKGSAGLVAGAALASTLVPRGAYAASDDTIKIALIGCGGRGSGAASQALHTKGPVKLIAVADAFEDNAKAGLQNLKTEHGEKVDVKEDHIFHGFDAYKQAIDAGPDVVVIATPPGFRPIHFEYAVKAGKHIFAEKPIATDPAGVRRFLAAVEESKKKNLKVGIGLQRHHQALYLETIKRIHDGMLGDLPMLRVYWNGTTPWVRPRAKEAAKKAKLGQGPLTEMEYQMRNWYFFNWLCGDHIVEQHIHNLDVANWIKKGPPAKAQGQGGRQVRTGIDNGEIYDHHFVEFTYPDGTVCLSQCRHQDGTWQSVSEHAHGTKGYADVSGGHIKLSGADGEDWKYRGPTPNPYQVEHDDFFAAIRDDKPYNEGEYGAHSTMTAIFGRLATYSGQEIKWEDALALETSIMPQKFAWDAPPPTLPDKDGHYPVAMPGVTSGDEIWARINRELADKAKTAAPRNRRRA
jgi:myo-inositol 2-dehydrogenase / D-chiro-inositol 1-dehydrogenase